MPASKEDLRDHQKTTFVEEYVRITIAANSKFGDFDCIVATLMVGSIGKVTARRNETQNLNCQVSEETSLSKEVRSYGGVVVNINNATFGALFKSGRV